ncbi:ATP-binding cassette domain-containing protein (plasmid) [Rathayibacter sp. VKM Ac-2803]|uniref:ABC transporter n=2 Tax=Microbacteriaceae TaxID=85023 RepID=A0A2T4UPC6_9MICO|nr:ATP-binding cassette domain-containing protein [Rathayibacter sp. VKM Ac-2803]PTL71367.1 ABC transporter [Rathayibacter caricis DSM 15933]PTL71395.1 ABC transporter [Rathayibacter caricis DSM 15933]
MVVFGLLASVLPMHEPNEARLDSYNLPLFSDTYPLGTDQFGRDIFSRLLHSMNTATVSALIGTSIALVIGTAAGLVGGYFQRVRGVTEWLFTLIMTFPGLLLLILLMPLTAGDYRYTMAIFGVLLSPGIYRIVRNQTIGVGRELYVDAARVSGVTNTRILARHVLSVVRGPIIVATSFLAGSAIGVQAGLAFLGVGSKEIPSFGAMIGDGFRNLYVDPLQYIWPSLWLGLLTACLVLFGNALRDAFEGARPRPAKLTVNGTALDEVKQRAADHKAGAMLDVHDLGIAYQSPSGDRVEVVRGVSLQVNPGEVLGLVGESGSGKTQTAFAVLGVLPSEAIVTRGSVLVEGRELLGAKQKDLHALRGSTIAYIPQEPMSNLDPVYTIGAQMVEGLRASSSMSRKDAVARVLALLERVGIADPQRTFDSYPHQVSGGMAQRVLIAGAVASRPKLLIADEPTTALDVTVQAEILDLLRDLQQEIGMAIILVTHNFGVVADICDRIAVMRNGEVVETGGTREVFADPKHPYTRMLLDAILDESTVRSDGPPARPITLEEQGS